MADDEDTVLNSEVLMHSSGTLLKVEAGEAVGIVVLDEEGQMVPVQALGRELEDGGLLRVHFTIVKLTKEPVREDSDAPWN